MIERGLGERVREGGKWSGEDEASLRMGVRWSLMMSMGASNSKYKRWERKEKDDLGDVRTEGRRLFTWCIPAVFDRKVRGVELALVWYECETRETSSIVNFCIRS